MTGKLPGIAGMALARLYSYPATARDWAKSFALHVITGVLAVAAHYSLMFLLIKVGSDPVVASGIGFTAGAATRYLLSHFKVFSPTISVPATLFRFLAALAAQAVANVVLLDLFLEQGLRLWVAQVTTTALLTVANFLAYRLWVFR